MSANAGFKLGSASNGRMTGQLSWLPVNAGGSPTPQLLLWYVKSSRLNQSPELKLFRSNDLERRMSSPAWKNGTPCDNSTMATPKLLTRTRSAMDAVAGILNWS